MDASISQICTLVLNLTFQFSESQTFRTSTTGSIQSEGTFVINSDSDSTMSSTVGTFVVHQTPVMQDASTEMSNTLVQQHSQSVNTVTDDSAWHDAEVSLTCGAHHIVIEECVDGVLVVWNYLCFDIVSLCKIGMFDTMTGIIIM